VRIPSAHTTANFINGNCDVLGATRRFTIFKDREIENRSFRAFCEERNVPLPKNYRQVKPRLADGFKSAAKYDKRQPILNEGAWALAGDWAIEHFHPVMSGAKISTENEVISELDLSTSCGYPWSLKYQGKRAFIEDPVSRPAITDFWNEMLDENNMLPIWTCSQKRELRSLDKLEARSHRTFTASPIELTCASNRLCLDMNERFYRGTALCWSFVGATKFQLGWDDLFHRLSKHRNAFELDESAYDSSLFARAMFGMVDFRWEMLRQEDRTPENYDRLVRLYQHIVHSVVVLENGELNQKHTGNPSGSGNTIVDNTVLLYRLFAYAWIILCEEQGRVTSRADFEAHVEAVLNGDDNTYTCSDEVVGWFTPANIARVWGSIGVVTNTPCMTPRPLSEVTFLSSGFRFDESMGIWMPCPETEKVLSSLRWGSGIDDVRWHFLRACALRLDSYGNPECRRIIASYIEYLNNNHRDQLVGTVSNGKLSMSMKEIRGVWKSDAWIEGLFCGRESVTISDQLVFESAEVYISATAQHKTISCASNALKNIPREFKQSSIIPLLLVIMPPKAKQSIKKIKKKVVKLAKKAGIVRVKGHGDYKPTRFARVAGHGGYFSDLGKSIGGLFGGAGGSIGHGLGTIADAGKGLWDIVTGNGDYSTRAAAQNQLHKAMGVTNPNAMNMGAMNVQFADSKGNPRVRHREFIGPVMGSTAFATQVYRIQPGLRGADVLFPWGSSVANCFEQYQLNGMMLEYKTTSTNYSSGVALGSVMMSTVYDAESAPLAGQLAVDNHEFTTSDVPSNTFIHPIECASSESSLVTRYVQATNAPSFTNDERFNDVGIFQISTIGMPAAANGTQVGELWASYDITFLKPALPDIHAGTAALWNHSNVTNPALLIPSAVSVSQWDQSNSYPVSILNNTQLQLPIGYAGTYQMTISTTAPLGTASKYVSVASFGSDITPIKCSPGYVNGSAANATPFASAEFVVGANGLVGVYQDVTNASSDSGYTLVFTFSTIAESLVNNVITFAYAGAGTTTPAQNISMLITAVDSDLPSGKYGVLPPTNQLQFAVRRRFEQRLLQSAEDSTLLHAQLLSEQLRRTALEERLLRLESIQSAKIEPVLVSRDTSEDFEEEHGISGKAKSSTPVDGQQASVHLSRSLMMDLLRRGS
jgi:hypothetical protein